MNTVALAIKKPVINIMASRFITEFFSRIELSALTKIATPLILSSLVTMSISITDVIMIGRLGTLELAAGAAASDFYSIFFYLAAGVAAAISPIIAQERGKHYFRNIKTTWSMGFIASWLMGVPAAIMVYNTAHFLAMIGVKQDIVLSAQPYAHMMAIAIFPMLSTTVMHYFLSACGRTRIILFVTALALPINIIGNYALLYGNWGFPQLGLAGAGIATAITGTFMFCSLLLYVFSQTQLRRILKFPFYISQAKQQFREIIKIGLPIGVSHFGEMGVFLFTTVTMGVFGAEVLAAHTIALRMAGVFYAIPLGYAQAATVRIGYQIGQKDFTRLRQTIKSTLMLAFISGTVMMIILMVFKNNIAGLFLQPRDISQGVILQTGTFLLLLAIMQPAMSLGTIGAGILRGHKDTRIPMLFSISSYWGIGFIGALILAFIFHLSGAGLWIGLIAATACFSILILIRIRVLFTEPGNGYNLTLSNNS